MTVLQNASHQAELQALIGQRAQFSVASKQTVEAMSKLGYRGILVTDTQGLIFPRGTRIQIHGTQVLAYWGKDLAPALLKLPKPLAIERIMAGQ